MVVDAAGGQARHRRVDKDMAGICPETAIEK
jgi:hypothetical protein